MDARRESRVARWIVGAGSLLLAGILPADLGGQDGGALFRAQCAACHSIGGGVILGPDLAGVGDRRDEDWLVRFIQDSPGMIAAGDPLAVEVSDAFPGLAMPPWPLTDTEVRAILAYVAEESAGGGGTTADVPVAPVLEGDPAVGAELFQGTRRFAAGGATCNSCHDVAHAGVLGGGGLAIELTTAHSRLSGPGVRAIITNPPFPAMAHAYRDRPLTPEEVADLAVFLQEVDGATAPSRNWRLFLVTAGVIGTAVLLVLYSLLWRGRKGGSVNHEIFARQVRSS